MIGDCFAGIIAAPSAVGLKEASAHSEWAQTLGRLVRGSAEESLLFALC